MTVSQLTFTATRFENNAEFRCEADNVVMRNEMDKPLHDKLPLEVLCKYQKSWSSFTCLCCLISKEFSHTIRNVQRIYETRVIKSFFAPFKSTKKVIVSFTGRSSLLAF